MTLPSGETFVVKHKLIIDKLETIECEQMLNKETGNLHINRADGVKMLCSEDFSKIRFPDRTLIRTWLQDDSIKSCSDVVDVPLPILHEIWWSESKLESKKIVDRVLN